MQLLIIFCILSLVLLIIGRLTIFPVFKWKNFSSKSRYSGKNTMFWVLVDPKGATPLAVVARELAEAESKWKIKNMLLRFTKERKRTAEAFRREVESHVAIYFYDPFKSIEEIRIDQAMIMIEYYPAFKGMKIDEVVQLMRNQESSAVRWFNENKEKLKSLERVRPIL